MTEDQEITLLANVKSLTDHMTLVDEVFAQMKVGRFMDLAFQCGHSGLYLPADYVKNWGRGYGIGLGPNPVSEVLDTDYHTPPPEITRDIQSFDQIMHPVGNCMSQVDFMLVDMAVLSQESAILAKDDPYMIRRVAIVREKQLANKDSRLAIMAAMWKNSGKVG